MLVLATGCAKDPGIGGMAEIQGRIIEQRYSNSGNPQGEPHPRAGRRVYISYSVDAVNDDDVRSGPDGRFRFPWLRKGTYRISVISQCQENDPDCPAGVKEVSRIVELTSRKDFQDIGDLLIENW